MRPRTGTWEKGEGFYILPLKEKEPVQVSGRIILNLRLEPSHKAGVISAIQICSATLDSHWRRTPPRPQGWLRFMIQVHNIDDQTQQSRSLIAMCVPVPNQKLKRMCRAIGADSTQARGLSSKWREFNDCCVNPPGSPSYKTASPGINTANISPLEIRAILQEED